jgi:hypothetical protein
MRHPVETQLRTYFEQIEETHGPISTNAVLERAAPVQVIAESRLITPPGRAIRRWAWAVALIVFAGVAILLGTLDSDPPPVDQPVPTTVPGLVSTTIPGTLPTNPPAPSGGGTLTTPIGDFEWWHISGADSALPEDGGWMFETPAGYSMIVGPWGTGVEYWTSPDGRAWASEPLPESLSGLEGATRVNIQRVGTTTWLISDQAGAWRFEAGTWTRVALPTDSVAFSLVGIGDDQVWLTSTNPVGVWRLDGEDWVALDPGIDAGDLTEGVLGGRAVGSNGVTVIPWDADTLTLIGSDDVSATVTPPWASQVQQEEGVQPDQLTLLSHAGGFVAFVVEWVPGTVCPPTRPGCDQPPDLGHVHLWTSSDGIEWTESIDPELLPEDQGDLGHSGQFQSVGGLILANVYDNTTNFGQVWVSDDGVEWELTALPSQGSFDFDEVGPGWISFGDFPAQQIYVSSDLRVWERVDTADLAMLTDEGGAGNVMWASTGNSFYVFQGLEGAAPGQMWVLDPVG